MNYLAKDVSRPEDYQMYYRKRNEFSVIDVFEDRHAISILLYVADNPGCKKTDLYGHIPRNAHTPSKVANLEDAGLLKQTQRYSSILLSPTDAGAEIAGMLKEIDRILKGENPRVVHPSD